MSEHRRRYPVQKATRAAAQWAVWAYSDQAGHWRQVGRPRNRYEAIVLARNLRIGGVTVKVMRVGAMPRAGR
jgi:hypothetical protein